MTKRPRPTGGFTLVELAVNLAITTTIMLALGGTSLAGYTAMSRGNAALGGDNAIGKASIALTRDAASASTVVPFPVTLTPGSGLVTFTPARGTAETYAIDAGKNLQRTVGGTTTVAGRGIAQVQITAGAAACQVQITLTPSQGALGAQVLIVSQRMLGC